MEIPFLARPYWVSLTREIGCAPDCMGVRFWHLLAKVMAHAKEVGEDEDKADDYNPLEATALLSMDAARVE